MNKRKDVKIEVPTAKLGLKTSGSGIGNILS
jgi:hypothetical protein